MQTVCLQIRLRKVCVHPRLAQLSLISRAKTLFYFHSTFPSTLFTCLRTKATLATSLQTFWQTWPARVFHLIPLPSGLTGAWILICLSPTIWLRRNFGPLFNTLVIPCAPVLVRLQPGNLSPSLLQMFSPCTLRKFLTRTLLSFLLAGSSFRCVFESKMAHLVSVQESRCRETSIRFFRGYTVLSSAATPLGQGGCELWVSSDAASLKDFCLLHADPRRLLVTLPLHGCTSLATVLHAPDRHHGEDAISVCRQETLDLLKRICPSGVPIIAMIDANAELGSEVSPFIGSKDAAQETFSGNLLHRFCAELLLTLPATHHEPTSCPNGGGSPHGGTPMATGEGLILLLFLCIGCRLVPMRTLGSTVSLNSRI